MEFRILGPLDVRDGDQAVELAGGRQRALLALLIVNANETVSTDRIVEELWGERSPPTAPKAIQNHVSQLRRGLGDGLLVTDGPGYRLRVDLGSLDVDRFEELLAQGRGALERGDAGSAADLLRTSLALWRGTPLADVAFEPFAQPEIARLEERRLVALEERIEADLLLGRHDDLVGELEALIAKNPLRERLRAQLMLALYRSGRQSEALAAYQNARKTLVDELGIEPGRPLRDLHQQILRQDEDLDSAPPARESAPRLQAGLSEPPFALDQLVGRARELAEAGELLRGDVRLLTLTGPGGTGKTRLALEIAHSSAPAFDEGARFVSLAALADPELVLPTITRALGIRALDGETEPEAMRRVLEDASLLLVLDNYEHVLEAAPVASQLATAIPQLTILTTSRAPLHVTGEHLWPVSPLDLPEPDSNPDPGELGEIAAVALFVERARAVQPTFELAADNSAAVAEICVRLDGLPLAIELAAAKVAVLPPEAMVGQLDPMLPLLGSGPRDAPERQQTLESTIGWSYELLTDSQRMFVRRLSVFSGGWTVAAATAVCDAVLDDIAALVETNLVRDSVVDGEGRFTMLRTIREFAHNRLQEAGEEAEAAHRAHAVYYLALAEQLEPDLERTESAALDQVESELDNFRAAFWWAHADDPELAVRLAAALRRFWYATNQLAEGCRWLAAALEGPHPASHDVAAVAAELGGIRATLSELEPAAERIDQAVEIAEALDLPDVLSDALNSRSAVLHRTGGDHEALLTIEGALKIARDRRLGRPLLRSLYNLSFSLGVWDREVEARRASLEGLDLAREWGNQFWEHHFIFNVVDEDVILGHWDAALRRGAASAADGQVPGVLFGEVALPWVLVQRGELAEARRILESMAPFAARKGPQSRSLEACARAVVLRAEGRATEALDAAEEVLARRAGLGGRHSYVKSAFVEAVEAAFALANLDRVAELLREWEEHSAERRTPFVEAQEQLFAARLAARRGEPEPVEPSLVRATMIFRELSMPFYVAVTLLERGEWLAGKGRGDDAESLLAEAREIFERLRAKPWLERVSLARPLDG